MKTNQILTNFTHTMALIVLALVLCLTTSPAKATPAPIINSVRFAAQSEGLTSPKELEAFLASLIGPRQMKRTYMGS